MIGMWKAFAEMEALGWIGAKRPKMIAVQAEGCAPMVRALERGEERSEFFENAETVASGLARAESRWAISWCWRGAKESGGTAIAVSDEEMIDAGIELASEEGIFAAPEGGACVAAVQKLLANGFLKRGRADRDLQHRVGVEVSGSVLAAVPAVRSGDRCSSAWRLGSCWHHSRRQVEATKS